MAPDVLAFGGKEQAHAWRTIAAVMVLAATDVRTFPGHCLLFEKKINGKPGWPLQLARWVIPRNALC